ncbi:MAG: hypothetical protein O9325_11075 [Roseomonas sp.]|nr:hypothetical protein [Roseomonas sp.]
MTQAAPSRTTPLAFSLKRHILQHEKRIWCPIVASDVAAAPIYVFPDQDRFNGDDIEQLALRNLTDGLKLPHPHCIFEVPEHDFPGACLASYVRQIEAGVESFMFRFDPERRHWGDVLAGVEFLPDGSAAAFFHPAMKDPAHQQMHMEAAHSMVCRALGILSVPALLAEQQLSRLRRAPFAKAGVRGWTYRVAEIRPATIASALAAHRGSHASPRWHLRRGHWRQLADGRRVFVRECEVGDASCGGVVKDYQVQLSEAA